MSAIDPNKCLPPELTIESVDDILYRIGLCFTSVRDRPKRKLIDHPLVFFTIITTFLAQRLITVTVNEDNEFIFKLLGDVGHFIGARVYFGIFLIMPSVMVLIFHLIYYYNHRNGTKPTFLRLFRMISGRIPPKHLGLNDSDEILQLVKISARLTKLLHYNNDVVVRYLSAIFVPGVFYLCGSLNDAVNCGIPNGILFIFVCRYFANFITYQFMYFFIICLYLKLKINSLNESLIEMKRRKRFIRIRETLQSLDSLYSEINEYNTTFWSKILGTFWLFLGSNCILLIFVVLFVEIVLFAKILFIYGSIFLGVIILFLIFKASSVTYSANKSYKTLNSLFISYSKHNTHNRYYRVLIELKVKH